MLLPAYVVVALHAYYCCFSLASTACLAALEWWHLNDKL